MSDRIAIRKNQSGARAFYERPRLAAALVKSGRFVYADDGPVEAESTPAKPKAAKKPAAKPAAKAPAKKGTYDRRDMRSK